LACRHKQVNQDHKLSKHIISLHYTLLYKTPVLHISCYKSFGNEIMQISYKIIHCQSQKSSWFILHVGRTQHTKAHIKNSFHVTTSIYISL